jgi:hypothetical protein
MTQTQMSEAASFFPFALTPRSKSSPSALSDAPPWLQWTPMGIQIPLSKCEHQPFYAVEDFPIL